MSRGGRSTLRLVLSDGIERSQDDVKADWIKRVIGSKVLLHVWFRQTTIILL